MSISVLLRHEIDASMRDNDQESLRNIFTNFHPADIAETLEEFPVDQVVTIIRSLRGPLAIEVMEQLSIQKGSALLLQLGRKEMVDILEEISPDDRTDLVRKISEENPDFLDEILPMMAQAERSELKRMISYEEDTAGSIMTTEYAMIHPEMTVEEALKRVRQTAPDSETIYYVYVTDHDRRLLGQVTLRELIMARPSCKVEDVMNANVISHKVSDDQEEVAASIRKYDFIAIPIVDDDFGRLVGIVTHDDAMDVVTEEGTEDAQMIAGIQPLEEPYFEASFWSIVRKRGLWLCILFAGGICTILALQQFQATLQRAMVLSFFLPLIISSGGNSGSQSVTLITRSLALGEFTLKDWFRIVKREFATGVSLGMILGMGGVVISILLPHDQDIPVIASIVGLTLISVVLCGTLLGSVFPLLLKRMGMDPAISSSPFVASVVDVLGIVIYFSIASYFLHLSFLDP